MKLVAIAALIAVCGAAKLDRTYLPPSSAATAGGSSDSLQTPLTRTSEQGDSSGNLPSGSFTNNFEGVVVEAAGAGTRASLDGDQSGLGAPRDSYGSQNSKVGDAAFRGSLAGFRSTPFGTPGFNGQLSNVGVGSNFGSFESKSERPQAFKDRNSNIISYANDVSVDNYSYGFETDNGIAIGENGVANNGIQAQGGYSYQGDDGQVYKVTYVADEGGYRPQGDHLPTPPPIPKEILESLEQNAKDEAAGLIDDGSYDAQKYNAEGDYTHHNSGNIQYNGPQLSQFAKRPESDATASNTFITQSSQAFSKPGQFGNAGAQNSPSSLNDQTNQFGANFVNNQNGLTGSQQQESSQVVSGQKESSSNQYQGSGQFSQISGGQVTQFGSTQGSQSSQFGTQNDQQPPVSQIGTQFSQFSSQTSQQGSLKPQSGGYSPQFGSQGNQQFGFTTQFNGQANQGPASSFVAQPNKPSFGTSSIFSSQQNQFNNQASKPQGSFGGDEYLPPFTTNDKTSFNKPQTDESSTSEDSKKDSQAPNFLPLGGQVQSSNQISSASSFASVQPQAAQVVNNFQNKPIGQNQPSFNNVQSNNVPINTQQSGTALGFASNAKPTSVPSIELTTPLESNENPKFPQGSQLNSQVNSGSDISGSLSLNNQPQTGFQNNFANQQPTSPTLSPSFPDSRPQGSSQFGSTSPAPISFSATQKPEINQGKPQFSQSQVQANNYYYTQKPILNQNTDDSYYYNQPSKPFSTPVGHPQGTRFPSPTSYQPNGLFPSQNNQFLNQQGSQSSLNNVPNTASTVPVAPTPSSQFSQTQSSFSTNGITQASISPFPSVSPTTSTQYSAQGNQFGSKPNVPSFPSRPVSAFGKNPSTAFSQNQIQFGQSSNSNNNLPSASQSVPSTPTTFGQQSTSSFVQSQTQLGQTSSDNDQPQNPETNQNEGAVSTQSQQYEGTVYEYNKPPEVLPAPEQTDSSSSQSVQTDTASKPQEDHDSDSQDSKTQSQPTQFSQNIFSAQQSSLNQQTKPESGLQTYDGSQSTQAQVAQNSQGNTLGQVNAQPAKPNQSAFLGISQLSQNQQVTLGSKPQFGTQPAKPFGSVIGSSQFGQNLQQTTNTNTQPFKPFTGTQTTLQFGQKTQTSFGKPQYNRPQFTAQSSQPFGRAPSQLGQISATQGTYGNGAISTQNNQNLQNSQQAFGITGSIQSGQSSKPFGTNGYQSFQGYPSLKPQFGNQLTLPQFSQISQQTLGVSQTNTQAQSAEPAKPFESISTSNGSPDSSKLQFDQISQVQQPTQTSGSSFSQYSFQTSQFGSSLPKPQFNAQAQFSQNNAPLKPFGSASSQAQVGPNIAQSSSSAINGPSTVQAYKPFGSSFNSNFQSQSKPQFDQAPQSSAVSTTSAPQTDVEPFGTGAQGQSPSQTAQSSSVPCCKSINKDSAIGPLNVGKPSQAFAQTQSQFTGFQGAQGFNAQSLAGQGEEFDGPRQPPRFDAETGYHYRK